MTIVRLGYVAMSVNLKKCSPSQTMTFATFQKLDNRPAAIRKLERIARSNLENCLRLLKHNLAHDIGFFRLSSRLVPLATHEVLEGWDYMTPIAGELHHIGEFAQKHGMRIDFHPDHFHVINTPNEEIFQASLKGLAYHRQLILAMGIDPLHRLVLHVGGLYKNKVTALERFVSNWSHVPHDLQTMIMLENDDKSFSMSDTLDLCEHVGVPFVFDYHHHLVNHDQPDWENGWERIVETWKHSPLPVKMHISSPKDDKNFRAHADFIDSEMFMRFLNSIKGSLPRLDCMIEAKQKDQALFQLVEDLRKYQEIEMIDQASFKVH